jgi:hypothetical protein
MQVKLLRSLPNSSQFVAYVDAMGDLDRKETILKLLLPTMIIEHCPAIEWGVDASLGYLPVNEVNQTKN